MNDTKDIKEYDRTFEVFIGIPLAGASTIKEHITIKANEDANKVCAEYLEEMFGNEFDSGWHEIEDD